MRSDAVTAVLLLLFVAGCASGGASFDRAPPDRPPVVRDEGGAIPPRPEPVASTGTPAQGMPARMLAAHNAWRKTVDVPPLAWSDALARYAQGWANTLQSRGCQIEHRPSTQYGENLAWASGSRLTPEQVVQMWGEERAAYRHATNSCAQGQVCGHYTQVVWRTTRAVGCGVARCGDSEAWVCNYDPPGNFVGERPY